MFVNFIVESSTNSIKRRRRLVERRRRRDRPVEREVRSKHRRRDEAHSHSHVPKDVGRVAAHDAADGHARFNRLGTQLGDAISNARRVSAPRRRVEGTNKSARVPALR